LGVGLKYRRPVGEMAMMIAAHASAIGAVPAIDASLRSDGGTLLGVNW
jgi:hypothetical protein